MTGQRGVTVPTSIQRCGFEYLYAVLIWPISRGAFLETGRTRAMVSIVLFHCAPGGHEVATPDLCAGRTASTLVAVGGVRGVAVDGDLPVITSACCFWFASPPNRWDDGGALEIATLPDPDRSPSVQSDGE